MLNRKFRNMQVDGELKLAKSGVLRVVNPNGTQTASSPSFETLIAARTVTANESGKTFFLDLAGGFAVTLPAPAYGLVYDFVVKTSPTTAYTVVTNASANIIKGFAANAAGAAVTPLSDGDTISFVASQAVAGDQANVCSDGTSWFLSGFAQVAAGITNTKAS